MGKLGQPHFPFRGRKQRPPLPRRGHRPQRGPAASRGQPPRGTHRTIPAPQEDKT